METIQDPKNIVGLSSLIDNDDLGSEIDLGKIEQEIIRGAKLDNFATVDHAEEYKREMERITQRLDVSPDYAGDFAEPRPSRAPSVASFRDDRGRRDGGRRDSYDEQGDSGGRSSGIDVREDDYQISDKHMRNLTVEEKKQNHINQVLGDIDSKELEGIDREREEDTKTSLLERIDMLRIALDDDGVDIKGVPQVYKNSSFREIQDVYKILRLKNDRNRYCSFAEELILAGAYGLENLFDGEKVWFGSYRPDLVGWSSTVKVKLRRMRYETSTFVGEIMENYQMSAGVRLMLELVPSIFLYSRKRKIAVGDNLANDKGYKDAISQLNSLN